MPEPNAALKAIFLPAFAPCDSFGRDCSTMGWDPARGHIPRGFFGATGDLEDVRLVLVCAEPGDPHPSESHSGDSPEEMFRSAYDYAYDCFKAGTDLFHRNVRLILNLCFPGTTFDEQMRHAWVTESVLCSARIEGGNVPTVTARACRARYLERQLELLPNAVVVALGAKARDRLAGYKREVLAATAAAPPRMQSSRRTGILGSRREASS